VRIAGLAGLVRMLRVVGMVRVRGGQFDFIGTVHVGFLSKLVGLGNYEW